LGVSPHAAFTRLIIQDICLVKNAIPVLKLDCKKKGCSQHEELLITPFQLLNWIGNSTNNQDRMDRKTQPLQFLNWQEPWQEGARCWNLPEPEVRSSKYSLPLKSGQEYART